MVNNDAADDADDDSRTPHHRYNTGDAVGPYILERRAGKGRYGVIFRAHPVWATTPIAVKLPRHTSSARDTLKTERRALDALAVNGGRAHIVQLIDTLDGAQPALVLEWMGGGDLFETLTAMRKAKTCLPTPKLRAFCAQLAEGLAWIHTKGLVHTDVKPENILLDAAHTHVKHCDFGNAQHIVNGIMKDLPMTTDEYRAPEVVLQRPVYTPAIDVWALGCTYFEMATCECLVDLEEAHPDLELTDDSSGDAMSDSDSDDDFHLDEDEVDLDTVVARVASAIAGGAADTAADANVAATDATDEESESASESDTWETTSDDEDAEADDEGRGGTARARDLLHLARLEAMVVNNFVPRRVRHEEPYFYHKTGKLRGNRRTELRTVLVAHRVQQSQLSPMDALGLSNLLSIILQFDPSLRPPCTVVCTHPWLHACG